MSFEKIGPFGFSRSDLVVASLALSFVLGSRLRRISMALIVVVAIIVMIGGIVLGDVGISVAAAWVFVWLLFLCPALQSRKRRKNINLSWDAEGLMADTDEVRTLYKWAGVRSWRKIGSRLFIMVTPASALVVADRFTDAANMEKLIATLAEHKAT